MFKVQGTHRAADKMEGEEMSPVEKEIQYLLERGFIKGWKSAAEAMEKIGRVEAAEILRSAIEPREKKHKDDEGFFEVKITLTKRRRNG